MPDNRVSFIDTSILVYAHDESETRKQPVAQALLDDLWRQRTGTLSTQVLQEFYVVATHKFAPPLRHAAAREIVALYGRWPTVQVDVALILAASRLEERHTLSFWDALIVESARRAGATHLLTEDLRTGRQVHGITIANPFA